MQIIKKIIFISLTAVFTSCGTRFKNSETGLSYKFIEDQEGVHARPGDILTLKMIYKTENDTMLFNSRMISDSFRLILKKPTFRGGMEEGLAMMSEGDSLEFFVNADSLYRKTFEKSMPDFLKPGQKIKFYARLQKISPLEEYEKELDAARKKHGASEKKRIEEYILANNITVEPLPDGLYFIETKKGTGKRSLYDTRAGIRYTGKFFNGKVFDSNGGKEDLFWVWVGHEEVIFAWDEALQQMSKGGKATIVVPSSLAYGERGSGPIEPYTPLVFDIEVVEVK